ncbi:alpha/beta fold hydrolase [Radiobacillus kanasensis]|uniref:alpha/beta fold hydrolase n=1 Tax=Radiobacillus kanasensis TaxID=2844358 RepID=UPI001E5C15C9|nr:alpha/beta hydrolase [Radiobacillus kanasensis]UFU00664.1 alpha/beta fold hydrolase [Radiobacillus kanasensis]
MKTSRVTIDGYRVGYIEGGLATNPTLVLLHGLAGSSTYSFAELMEELKEKYFVIAIDQPGHGKSDPFDTERAYLFSNLANWYEQVFSKLKLDSFYLIGHSWGADVALHYTKLYPQRVNGIILLDGAFTFPEFQEEMTFDYAYQGWKEYMQNASYESWNYVIDEYKTYITNWNPVKEQSVKLVDIIDVNAGEGNEKVLRIKLSAADLNADGTLKGRAYSIRLLAGAVTDAHTFSQWGEVLGSGIIATAILDRLLYHSRVFSVDRTSYRMKNKAAE